MMFDKCNSAYENSAFNLKEWEWFDKISQFRDAMQYNVSILRTFLKTQHLQESTNLNSSPAEFRWICE